MRINNIAYPAAYKCQSFAAATPQKSNKRKNNETGTIHDSLSTAASWFGFGVVLDFISRKITFSKSPLKNSVALNGVIALGAGLITCGKDVYDNRKKN